MPEALAIQFTEAVAVAAFADDISISSFPITALDHGVVSMIMRFMDPATLQALGKTSTTMHALVKTVKPKDPRPEQAVVQDAPPLVLGQDLHTLDLDAALEKVGTPGTQIGLPTNS